MHSQSSQLDEELRNYKNSNKNPHGKVNVKFVFVSR